MRRILWLLYCVTAPVSAQAPRIEPMPLEEIFAQPAPWGRPPRNLRIAADGELFATTETDSKAGRHVVLRRLRDGKRVTLPWRVRSSRRVAFAAAGHRLVVAHGRSVDAVGAADRPEPLIRASATFRDLVRVAGGAIVATAGNDHWLIAGKATRAKKLTLPEGARVLAKAGGAQRFLFRVGETSESSKLATLGWTDGRRQNDFTLPSPPVRTAFASDGATAAFVLHNDPPRGAPQLVPDFLSPEVSVRKARSARPGDAARLVRVHLVRFGRQASTTILALEPEKPAGWLRQHVLSLAFDARGRRLLVQTLDSRQQLRRLLVFDVARPKQAALLHEELDPAWIGPLARRAFFDATGKAVLFTSEVDDRARVFSVGLAPGSKPVALTPRDVLVDECLRLDDGRLLVSLAHPDPARRALALVDPARRRVFHLEQPPGWNERPAVARASNRVVFLHSRAFRAAEVWTTTLTGTSESRRLTRTTSDDFAQRPRIAPELVRYATGTGTEAHALLFMPKQERPARGWPAVIFLHGSGYLQNVRDSMTAYPRDFLFHTRLAARGYVVLCPDFAGSKGYGRAFRASVYKDLGGPDRRDVVAARRFLFDRCGVALSRIGIYGGSYGGFLTLMCLFKEPKAFACGAALRPVTDWLRYHPRYTHPRLGNPLDPGGKEVYYKASPIWFAKGLTKPLLLLHGMRDENVFVQDTLRLVARLVELGKDFDAMVYPSQGHAFASPAAWTDEYRRIERLFDRVLKPD